MRHRYIKNSRGMRRIDIDVTGSFVPSYRIMSRDGERVMVIPKSSWPKYSSNSEILDEIVVHSKQEKIVDRGVVDISDPDSE